MSVPSKDRRRRERLREGLGERLRAAETHQDELERGVAEAEQIARRAVDHWRREKAEAKGHEAELQELRHLYAIAAPKLGRRLAEMDANFRQEVLRLKRENDWGRPSIVAEIRKTKRFPEKGLDSRARRVLEEEDGKDPKAGDNPSANGARS